MVTWINRNSTGDQVDITREVGMAICEAFVAYDDGNYGNAVDLLYPVRYKVWKIGGSNAQVMLLMLYPVVVCLYYRW